VVELVRQRCLTDCGVCCLAMASGRPYEDVLAAIGDAYDPEKGMRYTGDALKRLGFAYTFENGEAVGDIVVRRRGFEISPEYFRAMAWGRRALLSVPSLNRENAWHMIYWDGRHVFDPSTARTYTSFADLKPEELVLFREGS